jgi:hypothetical protein
MLPEEHAPIAAFFDALNSDDYDISVPLSVPSGLPVPGMGHAGLVALGFLLLLGEFLLLQGFLRSLLLLFLGVLSFHGDVTGLSLPASAGGVVAVVA